MSLVDDDDSSLDADNVVGRKHPRLAGALDGSDHPAGVDRVRVDDEVAVLEGDFVVGLSIVAVHRLEDRALREAGGRRGGVNREKTCRTGP